MSENTEKITDYEKIKNSLKNSDISKDYPAIFDPYISNYLIKNIESCDPNRYIMFYLEKYPLAFVFDVITEDLITIVDLWNRPTSEEVLDEL